MSRSVSRHWERARVYLQQRNLPAAGAQLESLRALAPGDARTHLLTAQLAWLAGHPGEAAQHARAATRVAGEEIDVLGDLVATLLQVGAPATAHESLERPVWQQIGDADALLRYADQQRTLGQHAKALAAFERLIALRPEDGALHRYHGQQLEFLGRLPEAEAEYLKCLALDPGYARAAYSLVRLRRQTSADRHLGLIDSCLQRAARQPAARRFRVRPLPRAGRPGTNRCRMAGTRDGQCGDARLCGCRCGA